MDKLIDFTHTVFQIWKNMQFLDDAIVVAYSTSVL